MRWSSLVRRSPAASLRTLALLSVFVVAPSVTAAACSCGSDTSGPPTNQGTGGAGDGGLTGGGGTGGTIFDPDGGCQTSAQCDGGICVEGACCDSAEHVCGAECCTGATVCLVDKCVTPGKPCHTSNDCDPGQYCETALGEQPDGGAGGADPDGGCTEPLPLEGKCLDLPPVCDPDAGADPDAGCLAACEYHPPAGQLNAVAKWTWGPAAQTKPNFTDVWSTPAVGRIYDGNCDGQVDVLDSPNVVFVSGRAISTTTGLGTCCQCTGAATSACLTGVLRLLDGRTGEEIWSLDAPSANSIGFAGLSVAIGDIDNDGGVDIAAVTGEGYVVLVSATGQVLRTSDQPIPGHGNATFGWGGGLAIADMDGDGFAEIAYGPTVFTTTNGAITLSFTGANGIGGGGIHEALSTFVDLDGAPDGHLELLAGKTAYRSDGTVLWNAAALADGFPGVGDFDGDGLPEVVLVAGGQVRILEGATGAVELGPVTLGGTGFGGPPTVADFDGDGQAEIGVAQATFYTMLKPNYAGATIDVVWQKQNHDLSSSVTGSSVFDFEGDGRAEVIYADECFLWVYDGQTGAVRFAAPHSSFTATEASLVADVDGDGRSEIMMVSNSADPSAAGWGCMNGNGQPVTVEGVTWSPGPAVGSSYRGLVLFGDAANSWVGTRTLWSEHTYHVSNICDDRDTACDAPNLYGAIPALEKKNWTLPWLNNFRQNVQDKGIFDAPDALVSITVDCVEIVVVHVAVRNIGLASLPAPVDVARFKKTGSGAGQVGQTQTTHALLPGQTEQLVVIVDAAAGNKNDSFQAKIVLDPQSPNFHECREDNNESAVVKATCVQ